MYGVYRYRLSMCKQLKIPANDFKMLMDALLWWFIWKPDNCWQYEYMLVNLLPPAPPGPWRGAPPSQRLSREVFPSGPASSSWQTQTPAPTATQRRRRDDDDDDAAVQVGSGSEQPGCGPAPNSHHTPRGLPIPQAGYREPEEEHQ